MIKKFQGLFASVRWLLNAGPDSYLIYQPGKVGSSAIETALKKAGKQTYHVHQLKSHRVDFLPTSSLSRMKVLRRWVFLQNTNWAFKRSRTSVIVIVRDPVSHIRSLFFHHLDKIVYLYFKQHTDTRVHLTFPELMEKSFNDIVNLDYASDWLTDEFLSVTGFDQAKLAGARFPLQMKDNSGRRYLFLRYEELSSSSDELASFVGLQSLELKRVNYSLNKWYRSLYEEAKSNRELNAFLAQRLNQGLFAKTFYEV